jgi:amino acid transporter
VAEDTIIGMASAGLTLAALAVATEYGSGPIIILIAVIGIKLTARTQIGMALVEYAILIVFAIIGLVFVLGHHMARTRLRQAGPARPEKAERAAQRPVSSLRYSCSPAGTAPFTSMRKPGAGVSTPAGLCSSR